MLNARMETITPEVARSYLEKNTNNYRKISRDAVMQYANDIASGRWQENGEAIKFNEHGELVDGQHRLKAIVIAGVAVNMLVVRGVSESTNIYDIQRRRTIEQIVQNGIRTNCVSTYTVAAARNVLSYKDSVDAATSPNSRNAPYGEIIEFLEHDIFKFDEIFKICRSGGVHPKTRNGFVISALALYCRFCLEEHEYGYATFEEVKKFVDVVNSGLPIEGRECSNALIFRNGLYGMSSVKYKNYEIASVTMLAFRDFLNGVPRNRAYRPTDTYRMYFRKAIHEWDKYQFEMGD